MEEQDKQKHAERMQRKKAVVDAGIEKAQTERGIVILITGNGKGKTTSGFGTVFRALGHGHQCGVVQFIKGTQSSGEVTFMQQCMNPASVRYDAMATGFTWDTQNWDADKAAADGAWSHARRLLQDDAVQLVLLDELTYMLKFKFLEVEEVISAIRSRPAGQTVIITGRSARPELHEVADTISEIADVRHAYKAGVKAQPGIDF